MKDMRQMKLWLCVILSAALLISCTALAEPAVAPGGDALGYRFASANEAAEMLLSNREYHAGFNQNDLDYRMQKKNATMEDYLAIIPGQTLDYTDDEMAFIIAAMDAIEATCAERGYRLPATDSIVFAKTTMREECGAAGYTHGDEIYLCDLLFDYARSKDAEAQAFFNYIVTHELFHCLTRNHPDFRAAIYGILGFEVAEEDYPIGPSVREVMISNPDVEHHNAHAAFEIDGEMRECVAVFATSRPFDQPGDSFFTCAVTGLVPIDDPDTMYTADDAANFWEVFGRNTDYVIDPEETMADNFAYTLVYGPEGRDYANPEIIEAIDALLKAGFKG